jgi:hypothetical protein
MENAYKVNTLDDCFEFSGQEIPKETKVLTPEEERKEELYLTPDDHIPEIKMLKDIVSKEEISDKYFNIIEFSFIDPADFKLVLKHFHSLHRAGVRTIIKVHPLIGFLEMIEKGIIEVQEDKKAGKLIFKIKETVFEYPMKNFVEMFEESKSI